MATDDFFRARLDQMIDLRHPLAVLAGRLPWAPIEAALAPALDRLRTHLMKRHKVKDRGTGLRRFPSSALYGCYGLYKVLAVAGWRSAHASV